MNTEAALNHLKQHPAFKIADLLAETVGVDRDLVQLTEFLSLAGGKMVLPINLDIQTDNLTVDLYIANRILDLHIGHVARVDTHREFRALEKAGFSLRHAHSICNSVTESESSCALSTVILRGNHRLLHRDVTEYTARMTQFDSALPSLWRICDTSSRLPPIASILRIQTTFVGRGLEDFGFAFSTRKKCSAGNELSRIVQELPKRPDCICKFRDVYRGKLPPEMMLIFERLLCVFAGCRLLFGKKQITGLEISYQDYFAARGLLVNLPLTPIDRLVSPQALVTAENIYEAQKDPKNQLSLPDHSAAGHRWFTRHDAMEWSGLAYNTAKKHLDELEGEGVLRTTISQNNRERGRKIHFRFANSRTPPFSWSNPFHHLPVWKVAST